MAQQIPASVLDAYRSGKMAPEDRAAMESAVASGEYAVPDGFGIQAPSRGGAPPAPGAEPRAVPATGDSVDLSFTPTPPPAPTPAPYQEPVPVGSKPRQVEAGFPLSLMEAAFPHLTGRDIKKKYEDLPDWFDMPEMSGVTMARMAAQLGTLATGAEETKKILETQFPKAKIRQDGKYLIIDSQDGKQYAYKPGLRGSDVKRMVEAGLITLPVTMLAGPAAAALGATGAGAAVLGGALGGAGAAATHELLQAGAGGQFDTGQVLLGGLMGGAIPAAGKAFQTTKGFVEGVAPEAANAVGPEVRELPFKAIGQMPGSGADPQAVKALASSMAEAARNPESAAAAEVAAQVKPDPEVIAAANRQGVLPHLQPDHVSTNDAFQQLSQAIKATPGGAAAKQAELGTVNALAARGKKILTDIGANPDLSVLDYSVKDAAESHLEDLRRYAEHFWKKVTIPKSIPAPATNLNAKLDEIATNSNGVLPKVLARIRKDLTENPTWQILDRVKKTIGAATKGKGDYGKGLAADPGLAQTLFAEADKDVMALANSYAPGDVQGQAFRNAQTATMAKNAYRASVQKTFGDLVGDALAGLERNGSIIQPMKSAMSSLQAGVVSNFVNLMKAVPHEMREAVASSALLSNLVEKGQATLENFVSVMDGLAAQKRAHAALMSYLAPEARAGINDVYRVASAVTGAMSKQAASASEALAGQGGVGGYATRVFGLIADNTAGRALNAAGIPSPPGGFTNFLLAKVSGADKPLTEAISEFLLSPAGRAGMDAAASGAPVRPGFIKSVASSPTFTRLADAAGVAVPERQRALEKLIGVATVNTPPRATQQPEEK